MTFDIEKSIEILERTPLVLEVLLDGLSDEWTKNNEGSESWSPYDVVGHLIHGEKTDWVTRAKVILSDGENKTFTPFDRFAQLQTNQQTPLKDLLKAFKKLRDQNLEELKAMQIDAAKLRMKGMHPELGEANLKELLSTWVVHDLGHISQITRVMAKQYKSEVGPWEAYLGILKK